MINCKMAFSYYSLNFLHLSYSSVVMEPWMKHITFFILFIFCHQSGSSACVKTPCQLCQLTKGNPLGFTCTCPNSKVLLLDGICECRLTLLCLSHKCQSLNAYCLLLMVEEKYHKIHNIHTSPPSLFHRLCVMGPCPLSEKQPQSMMY